MLITLSSLPIINENTFRFVPALPNKRFDHIYTDRELYDIFNLPDSYREMIDSIVRERKI
jgi:hypothetical protein